MIPPPLPELVRNTSSSPRIVTIHSITTCSSSVHAGEHDHCCQPLPRVAPTWPAGTHVEPRVRHRRAVHVAKDGLERDHRRKVREELGVLPVGYTGHDEALEVGRDGGEGLAFGRGCGCGQSTLNTAGGVEAHRLTTQLLEQIARLDAGLYIALPERRVVVTDLVDGGIAWCERTAGGVADG